MSVLSSDFDEMESDLPPNCPVELHGEGKPILVQGRSATGTTGVAYRALEALCAAFPGGLTRRQLNKAAGSKDARRALQYLVSDEPWKSAHVIVGDRGTRKTPTRYRIAAYRTIWGWLVKVSASGAAPGVEY